MPSPTKVDLYLGKNVGQLNQQSDLSSNLRNTNPRILVKTAEKVIKEAQHTYTIGDEEKSYILYMRYFNVITLIKKSPDYKKQKDFFDSLLGKKNVLEAINRAEDLAKSLKDRYDLKEAQEVAKKLESLKYDDKSISDIKIEKTVSSEEDKNERKGSEEKELNTNTPKSESPSTHVTAASITCMQLYALLQDKEAKFIVMDVRSSHDYEESKINHQSCINVPEENITAGTTVSYIEKTLPQASKSLWKQRGDVEKIIVIDWNSTLDKVTIGTPMRTLKDALFKYDSTVILKNEPLILDGGYEQWLLYYPMLTTNANVKRASSATPDLEIPSLNFDYPDFDTAFLMTPSPDSQDFKNKITAKSNGEIMEVRGNLPRIDRSTKPGEKQTFTAQKRQIDQPPPSVNSTTVINDKNSMYPSISDLLAKKSTSNDKKVSNKDSVDSKVLNERERSVEEIHQVHIQKEEDYAAFQKERKRMEQEQKARIDELKEEEQRLEDLARLRKSEEKALADLMRKKRQIEDTLRVENAKQAEEYKTQQEEENKRKEELQKIKLEEEKKKQLLIDVEKMRTERKKKEEKLKQEKLEEEKKKQELEEVALREAAERAKKEADLKDLELKQTEERVEKLRKEEQDKAREQRERIEREKQQIRLEAEKKKVEDERNKVIAQKLAEEAAEKERLEKERKLKEEQLRVEEARLKKEKDEQKAAENAMKEAEQRMKRLEAAEQRNQPKTVKSPMIPSGWEKMLDKNTNRFFYVNHNLGTTQWESPYVPSPVQSETSVYTTKLKEEPKESKRGLSRSHSFSNLSKIDDDSLPSTPKIPSVDRTKKPTARPEISQSKIIPVQRSRVRDFNPVYGSVSRGLTGLRNLGNTCYMNSTIQCLNNTSPMVSHFLTDKYVYDLNRDNISGDHGEVTEEFAAVIKALWSGQYRFISPRDLKVAIGKHMPMFEGYSQQDSQEFLTFLLDGLHEGLNKVQQRPKIPELKTENLSDHTAADASWKNHIKLNNSVIVDLFQGQLKSTLRCLTCNKKSVKFEAFMFLSVPIPNVSRCSLQDCIKAFLKEEHLTGSCRWKCPQCKKDRDAVKKIDLWKLPKILLIGLNRFMTVGVWREKDTRYVDFPLTDLNINQYVIGVNSGMNYNLYGVSNHFGTMEGGHYTAFCKNPQLRKWYKFDDHESYEISSSDVKSNAAFVLFYTSFNFEPPHFSSLFS